MLQEDIRKREARDAAENTYRNSRIKEELRKKDREIERLRRKLEEDSHDREELKRTNRELEERLE